MLEGFGIESDRYVVIIMWNFGWQDCQSRLPERFFWKQFLSKFSQIFFSFLKWLKTFSPLTAKKFPMFNKGSCLFFFRYGQKLISTNQNVFKWKLILSEIEQFLFFHSNFILKEPRRWPYGITNSYYCVALEFNWE